MKESRSVFWAILLAALTAAPASATDPNRFPNGDFSATNQITGWHDTFSPPPAGATFSWSNDDSDSNPASGSIQLDSSQSFAAAGPDCFIVEPGAAFSLIAHGKLVSGTTVTASAGCAAFSDVDCQFDRTTLGSVGLALGDSWSVSPVLSGALPEFVQSVQCQIVVTALDSQAPGLSARFDNLFFFSANPVIFANGFEALEGP